MNGELKKVKQLILQIVTVVILFTVAVYGLWRINLIRLPAFIENIINTDESSKNEYISTGYEIFNHIERSEEDATGELLYPTIKLANLTELLNSVEPYEHYYWESRAEIFSSGSSRVFECKSRISENKYNVEILNEQGNTVRKCISDGNKTLISQQTVNGIKSREYNYGLNDFFSDSFIVSVDYFKNTDFSNLDTQVKLVNQDDYNLVSVVYSYNRSGTMVKNNFLVSLDFGVVLFAECKENDVTVYKLHTNSIYPLSSLDSDIFTVN